MVLTVTTEIYPEYLKVVVVGDLWSMDDVLKIIENLKDETDRAGRSRILADLRGIEHGEPSSLERYDAGRHVAMFLPGYRLAVVTYARQITHFSEMVANNRGAVMAMFASEDDAIQWLLR